MHIGNMLFLADSGGQYDVEKEEAKVSDQNHMQ